MRLESTAVALRRREPWEAIDLGFAMLRQWWRPAYAAWAVTYLPAAAVLLAVFWRDPWLAALLLWWLKPVFDRIVLHVLSRAVFGEELPLRRLLADRREYLSPGLVAGQLWGRLDFARSFDLPVWTLERERGAAGRKRRTVLQKRARYHAVWLTTMCGIFEGLIFLGGLLLVEIATPAAASSGWFLEHLFDSSGADGPAWGMEETLAYIAAVTLIEPFYVAGGFALYLNRRTLLEGWDLELALRRCAERLEPAKGLAAALLVAFTLLVALPQPGTAAEGGGEKSAQAEIAAVLKSPDFPQELEKTVWRVRWPEWPWGSKEPAERDAAGLPVGEVLATIMRIVLWIAVAVAIGWLIYYLAKVLPRYIEPAVERAEPPPALFGLEIAPETLPADVAGAAARLLAEGRVREALSLLYRGALSALVHAKGVEFQAGDTERDCLRRAAPALPREGHTYLGELLAAWEAAAYAGRLPDPGRAGNLVAGWPAHFAQASAVTEEA